MGWSALDGGRWRRSPVGVSGVPRLGHLGTFDRSGPRAPHGSLSLRAGLRGQPLVVSIALGAIKVNSLLIRCYRFSGERAKV
jgi:hypothetical protein